MARPKGGYRLADGTQVPGVTTVIDKTLPKPALVYWAFEQGKSYERGEISGLYDKRDEAADFGTKVHELVEKTIKGKLDPAELDDVPHGVRFGYEAYLDWQSMTKLKVIATELEMVSEKHGYAGTPDAIGQIGDNQMVLLDWKTSKGVYDSHLIQVAAYANLLEEHEIMIDSVHIVVFNKESGGMIHRSEKIDSPVMKAAWRYFLLSLEQYHLQKVIK